MKLQIHLLLKRIERLVTSAPKGLIYGILSFALRNSPPLHRLKDSDIQRVLLLRYDRAGDMIISLPTVRFLRRHAPHAHIDVLASASNARIAQSFPDVDSVFIMPDSLLSRLTLFRKLRSSKYDLVIACITNRSTFIGLLCSYLTSYHGISLSPFRGEKYNRFFHVHSRSGSARTYAVEKLLYSVPDAVECAIEPHDVKACMYVPEEPSEHVRRWLTQCHLKSGEYALLNISVRTERNTWTDQGYISTVKALRACTGRRVVITAMPDEMEKAHHIAQMSGSAEVYAATKDIMEIASLVQGARIVVTPDTAVVHMCSALEVPMVGLYCYSETEPREWGPTHPHLCVVVSSARGKIVRDISSDEVVAAIENLMNATGHRA